MPWRSRLTHHSPGRTLSPSVSNHSYTKPLIVTALRHRTSDTRMMYSLSRVMSGVFGTAKIRYTRRTCENNVTQVRGTHETRVDIMSTRATLKSFGNPLQATSSFPLHAVHLINKGRPSSGLVTGHGTRETRHKNVCYDVHKARISWPCSSCAPPTPMTAATLRERPVLLRLDEVAIPALHLELLLLPMDL